MRRDGQTDGGTDMKKLRATFFFNFAKTPKISGLKSGIVLTEATKSVPLNSGSDDECRKFLLSTFVCASAIS
jgi:hypothetical protein